MLAKNVTPYLLHSSVPLNFEQLSTTPFLNSDDIENLTYLSAFETHPDFSPEDLEHVLNFGEFSYMKHVLYMRNVPAKLLKTMLTAEVAEIESRQNGKVGRAEKSELKAEIHRQLEHETKPTKTTLPVVVNTEENLAFAFGTKNNSSHIVSHFNYSGVVDQSVNVLATPDELVAFMTAYLDLSYSADTMEKLEHVITKTMGEDGRLKVGGAVKLKRSDEVAQFKNVTLDTNDRVQDLIHADFNVVELDFHTELMSFTLDKNFSIKNIKWCKAIQSSDDIGVLVRIQGDTLTKVALTIAACAKIIKEFENDN